MNKYSKTFIVILITFLCAIIVVGFFYYEKTIETFKYFKNNFEVSAMGENLDISYIELKKSLKEKYTNQFITLIKDTKTEYFNEINAVLGDDYAKYRDELISIENQIKSKREEFLNSDKYLTAKQEMAQAKLRLDLAKPDEKEEKEEEFQKTLSNISTLNITLNNSLKGLKEQETNCRNSLKALFDNNREELVKINDNIRKKTKNSITNIIENFLIELKELNDTFNVELSKNELPFDIDTVKVDSISTQFEKEYFNGIPETEESSSVKVETVYDSGYVEVIKNDDIVIN